MWTQAPVRRAEMHFQGQLLCLGGRTAWRRCGTSTLLLEDSQLLCRKTSLCGQDQSCLLSIFPTVIRGNIHLTPRKALSRASAAAGDSRLKVELAAQLPAQMLPLNIVFFQLSGVLVEPARAALSPGNCTTRTTPCCNVNFHNLAVPHLQLKFPAKLKPTSAVNRSRPY